MSSFTTLNQSRWHHKVAAIFNLGNSLFQNVKLTPLIRTPHYYGQFAVSPEKKLNTFSLNSTSLIWTPLVNTNTFYASLSVRIKGV